MAEVSIKEVQEIFNASSSFYEYTNFSIPPSLYSYEGFIGQFLPNLKEQLLDLIYAPLNHPQMFWIIIPLIITLFVMEFYFGRYKRETLGWNTAVGNSLVLIYVSFSLFNYLTNVYQPDSIYELFSLSIKPWIALMIVLQGAFLLLINYFHLLPSGLTFFISSALPVNLTAYVATVFVYTRSDVDFINIIAAICLLLILFIVFRIIRLFEYEAATEDQDIKPTKKELYLRDY